MRIDVKYNQAPQRPLSFWEQWQIMEILSQYPALTLKVLLHRRVGLRRAEPMHVLIMAALLALIALKLLNLPLGIFALAVAVAGCLHHINRWKELRADKATPWHTYSEGISPLEDWIVRKVQGDESQTTGPAPAVRSPAGLSAAAPLPLDEQPRTLRSTATAASQQVRAKATAAMQDAQTPSGLAKLAGESRIYRRFEPIMVSVLGWIFVIIGLVTTAMASGIFDGMQKKGGATAEFGQKAAPYAQALNLYPLGLWLIFAAACLATNENVKWRHQISAYLDWYDSQIDGAAVREWGGKKGKQRTQAVTSRRQSYGLPTGIGTDLRACVERQAEGLGQPPQKEPRPPAAEQPRPTILDALDNLEREPQGEGPTESRETVGVASTPERLWDVRKERYYTQSVEDAEKERLDAARDTWDLPPPAPPDEDNQTTGKEL